MHAVTAACARLLDALLRRRGPRGGPDARHGWPPLGDRPCRLHLGCGADVRAGWLNVDVERPRGLAPGLEVFEVDLRRGIPLPDGSCQEIYTSHFLEHLAPPEVTALIAECHRVLVRGGRLRIVVPDFEACCRAYLSGDDDYFAPLLPAVRARLGIRGQPLPIDMMQYVTHQVDEHRSIFDAPKLVRQLSDAGFVRSRQVMFDPSVDIDSLERRRFSLYVEGYRG